MMKLIIIITSSILSQQYNIYVSTILICFTTWVKLSYTPWSCISFGENSITGTITPSSLSKDTLPSLSTPCRGVIYIGKVSLVGGTYSISICVTVHTVFVFVCVPMRDLYFDVSSKCCFNVIFSFAATNCGRNYYSFYGLVESLILLCIIHV